MTKPTTFHDLIGLDLGPQDVSWTERDAILYALACGARAEELDLVYERDLRPLPGMVAALGLWAVERCGELGVYDRKKSLHVSQGIVMHRRMARAAVVPTRGRVVAVWDKGKATIVEIEVSSDVFTASYSIFLPGIGGCLHGASCTYDNTVDEDFIIDTLPGRPDTLLITGLSGHGFKFASVLGEIAAQFAQGIAPQFDLTPFSLSRFNG